MDTRYYFIITSVLVICLLLLSIPVQFNLTMPRLSFTEKERKIPSGYQIKNPNDSCPEYQKMTYYPNDTGPASVKKGCVRIAEDAGKECLEKSDCINSCMFSMEDYNYLRCRKPGPCPDTRDCPKIAGRCAATPAESNLAIPTKGRAYIGCGRI